MEKVNFTPDEREAANAYIRAQLKRTSEDDYIREEERRRADILVGQARREERKQADAEKADLLQKADIRVDQARKEEREQADAEKADLLQKADAEKADLLERIRQLESLNVSDGDEK